MSAIDDELLNQSHEIYTGATVRCVRDAVEQGCTNPNFGEYDAAATVDDGSCLTPNAYAGCTDPAYFEYDPYASEDDGSCTFLSAGYCTAPAAFDGYTYEVVAIGQCWFAENLRPLPMPMATLFLPA